MSSPNMVVDTSVATSSLALLLTLAHFFVHKVLPSHGLHIAVVVVDDAHAAAHGELACYVAHLFKGWSCSLVMLYTVQSEICGMFHMAQLLMTQNHLWHDAMTTEYRSS